MAGQLKIIREGSSVKSEAWYDRDCQWRGSIQRQVTGKGARLQGGRHYLAEQQEFKGRDFGVFGSVPPIHVRDWNTSPVGIKTMSSYTKKGLQILRHSIKIKDS